MRPLTLPLVLALLTVSWVYKQQVATAKEDSAAKAQAILAQARAALGSEAKWKAVTSVAISGNYQRKTGSMDQSGDWQLDIALPDKLLLTETFSPISSIEITRIQALNGDQVWADARTNNSGGAHVVVRAPSVSGSAPNTGVKADMARLLLGCLLTVSPGVPFEFTHAGVAEAPDGKADVLEFKHAGASAGRLFIDQKSHHPLMLTYQGRKVQVAMTQQAAGAMPSPEEMEKRAKEAHERAANAPLVEFQMRFEDFREEGGIRVPHRITKSVNEETTEAINLTQFKWNASLKADHFVKK